MFFLVFANMIYPPRELFRYPSSQVSLHHVYYIRLDHFNMRTYGVNQAFRFVESILITSKKPSNLIFFFGKDLFYFISAQHVLSYHDEYLDIVKGRIRSNGQQKLPSVGSPGFNDVTVELLNLQYNI